MRFFALALVLLAALAGSALPAAKPSPAPSKAAAPALPDAELEKAIRARLAKSKISANNFQVKVTGGTAVLTGKTDVIQHKGVATRIARSAGARAVDNRIEISEAARRRAAERLSRNRTKARVSRVPATAP